MVAPFNCSFSTHRSPSPFLSSPKGYVYICNARRGDLSVQLLNLGDAADGA